eukprot:36051-Rhodomonas_salina.2
MVREEEDEEEGAEDEDEACYLEEDGKDSHARTVVERGSVSVEGETVEGESDQGGSRGRAGEKERERAGGSGPLGFDAHAYV